MIIHRCRARPIPKRKLLKGALVVKKDEALKVPEHSLLVANLLELSAGLRC
jgi:hypothetical protein